MLESLHLAYSSAQPAPLLQPWKAQVCSHLARPDHGPHSRTCPPLRALILGPDPPPPP